MKVIKSCCRCKVLKSLNAFYTHSRNGKIDYHTICKSCQSIIKDTKYDCECGKQYSISHKKRHLRSSYHIKKFVKVFENLFFYKWRPRILMILEKL